MLKEMISRLVNRNQIILIIQKNKKLLLVTLLVKNVRVEKRINVLNVMKKLKVKIIINLIQNLLVSVLLKMDIIMTLRTLRNSLSHVTRIISQGVNYVKQVQLIVQVAIKKKVLN